MTLSGRHPVFRDFQDEDTRFGDSGDDDLWTMTSVEAHRPAYDAFVGRLAKKIYRIVHEYPIPPAAAGVNIKEVRSAFHEDAVAPSCGEHRWRLTVDTAPSEEGQQSDQRHVPETKPPERGPGKFDIEPGAHVFVSYKHDSDDSAYVEKLVAYLTRAGVPVWLDREIIVGDRWERLIATQIETCAALVVVMTPRSEKSDWVSREINYAELKKKPIFPLLLHGTAFFRLSNLHHEDVTGGRMPGPRLISTLKYLSDRGDP